MLNVRVYAARALKVAEFYGSDVTPGSNAVCRQTVSINNSNNHCKLIFDIIYLRKTFHECKFMAIFEIDLIYSQLLASIIMAPR